MEITDLKEVMEKVEEWVEYYNEKVYHQALGCKIQMRCIMGKADVKIKCHSLHGYLKLQNS